ncbi:Eukaryotic translation initiation factor 3 subunit K [Colletotrichum sidae]|uniref:Eukaryotic translation initiation factor 3 subunit K n=2 Tax=Colletotrichum orbiculare species complex TaxID=2707354 RepID=N4VXK5_COLOR|nr:Eukaryotic translation initiation factor 3 subunit K [Colletotrichum orbiculare MAFF 240422]TEA18394.1 Eukaryotic translation initiation factor 3 subunit K [Colletotrichum sidae]
MLNGEDPPERPDYIVNIINGLERYNPEAVGTLESYLQEQCDQKYCDCNANRTLLKLYQLNPDRMKDEVVTNILVKAMTQFPSPQFSLALHLINASAIAQGELHEAVAKLRTLNSQLEGAQYARFWNTIDGDDLCADLIADISGFEDLIRNNIVGQVSQAFREVSLSQLESWLGLSSEATAKFASEVAGWTVGDNGIVTIPKNAENEAKKAEIREDVNVDMFSRVLRRSWEETA